MSSSSRPAGLSESDTVHIPGPNARRVLELDRLYVSPSYTRPYPLVVRRASGATVEDVDGNQFLDFTAGLGVASTGHCHPAVVEAIQRQAGELLHMSASDFYYELLAMLAEKLARLFPGGGENKVFFCNSGTEAVEAALKLARYATRRDKIIAFTGAFHGRTLGALSLTASKPVQRAGFGPLLAGVIHLPYPNPYRRPQGISEDDWGLQCARAVNHYFASGVSPAAETAAIFVEPLQGEGGYIVPPASFLRELRHIAGESGILLVFDEVQSGMGRTGKMWACEHFDVRPDILITAKGIASGMPLGAIIAPAPLMDWPAGAHASTFGGNPISAAAALATIELLEKRLIDNAARVGAYILERLARWPRRYPRVGDVRGLGLMIGIEFVEEKATKAPDAAYRDRLVHAAFRKSLLVLGCGSSSLRLSPPLVITREQADSALDTLESCMDALA